MLVSDVWITLVIVIVIVFIFWTGFEIIEILISGVRLSTSRQIWDCVQVCGDILSLSLSLSL